MFSKNNKFIFIEIYRSGSRSVVKALEKYQYNETVLKKITRNINKNLNSSYFKELPPKHSTYEEYLNFFGKKYNNYFSFAFSRNPFSWQVSIFHYMKEQVNHPQHNIIKNFSFDEYIYWRCNEDHDLQNKFVFDKNKNLKISYLGKLENINNDFKFVCKELNIKNELKHINQTKHSNYRSYYSTLSEKMILKYYEEDFDLLGYPKKLYS